MAPVRGLRPEPAEQLEQLKERVRASRVRATNSELLGLYLPVGRETLDR